MKMLRRLYADYLMPSRLGEYDSLLQRAHDAGYAQMSVRSFHRELNATAVSAERMCKVLVHRHDIDSDLRTAKKMFALESKHGITASYYFRLTTLDFGFMRDIEAAGSEASYHYEEVADYAKRHRIRCPHEIRRRFPEIREQFIRNFNSITERLGLKMVTVASHGDFANRRLKVINHELLLDHELRQRCGIECESYDAELLRHFDAYISDREYPHHYYPMSPFEALGRFDRICFLTHPIQWETNWIETTRCNLRRVAEEIAWRA